MDTITEVTGITGTQAKNALFIAFLGCIMLGIGEQYVTIAVGVGYPALMSFLALESAGTADDKQWLTYWTVFGAFNIIDHFAHVITDFIPFYLFFKVLFLLWLMHPSTNGALVLYNAYILPGMKDYEAKYAPMFEKVEEKLAEAAEQATEAVE